MPVVALEFAHRRKRLRRAVNQLLGGYVSEVVRSKIGQQRQTDVGGGCAMGDRRCGVLLVVVRWKEVVRWTHEGLEETPRTACDLPEEHLIFGPQLWLARLGWSAQPPRHGGGKNPKAQDRPGRVQGHRPCRRDHHRGDERNGWPNPHRPVESQQNRVRVPPGVVRGLPFQESPAREEHAYGGAGDCVETEECVVRHTEEGHRRLGQLSSR